MSHTSDPSGFDTLERWLASSSTRGDEPPEAAAESSPRASERIPRGSETILVVEDDEPVRRVVSAVLEAQGYRVLAAARPDQAVLVAQEAGGAIDLVLIDVVLAGANGVRLAERFAAGPQPPKVLFMSGHTDKVLAAHGVDPERHALLRKAFTPNELALAVRAALDRPGAMTA